MALKNSTLDNFPDITAVTLLESMNGIKLYGDFNNRLRCLPEAYIAIKDYFIDEENEKMKQMYSLESKPKPYNPAPPNNSWGTIYGVDIVLDPDLKPGEWIFE